MTTEPNAQAVRALYAWYEAMGMSLDVGDQPTDWYALSAAPPTPMPETRRTAPTPSGAGELRRPIPTAPTSAPARGQAPATQRPAYASAGNVTNREAVLAAREAATSARTLGELHARLADFDGCALKRTAKALCFYRGAPDGRVMVVGEAPGEQEDKVGKPFVGPAGQLLDKMLAAIGLSEADCHITNVVYWRPPRNRTPSIEETEVCIPFLQRQIELVAPDVLIAVGKPASQRLFETTEGILRLRGNWQTYRAGDRDIRALATLHPAYLLRQPAYKRQAWQDMLTVRAALDEMAK